MSDDGLRLYGTTDHDMDQPPANGGMRGEGHAVPEGSAGWRHDVTLGNGHRVAVEEVSGLSHAEATGAVMTPRAATPSRGEARAVALWPLVVVATLGFAVGQRWRRGGERGGAARDAGAASVRERAGLRDRVGQESGELATDPPVF